LQDVWGSCFIWRKVEKKEKTRYLARVGNSFANVMGDLIASLRNGPKKEEDIIRLLLGGFYDDVL